MMVVNGVGANTVAVLDRGLMYGDGVFRTLALRDGKLLTGLGLTLCPLGRFQVQLSLNIVPARLKLATLCSAVRQRV